MHVLPVAQLQTREEARWHTVVSTPRLQIQTNVKTLRSMSEVSGPPVAPTPSPADLMRGLLEGVPDAAAVLDLDLRAVAFNSSYSELLRTAFHETPQLGLPVPASVACRVGSDDLMFKEALLRTLEGASRAQELLAMGLDEKSASILSRSHPIRNDEGRVCGILHIIQDVSGLPPETRADFLSNPLRRLSLALKLSEAQERTTEAHDALMRVQLFVWDAGLGDLTWSGSLADFVAMFSHLPPVSPINEHMHPDDARRLAERLEGWQREGRHEVSFDFRLLHGDGRERWMQAWARLAPAKEGESAKLVGINIDVTDFLLMERRLAESRAAYERLFDVSVDAIVVQEFGSDGTDRLLSANAAFGHIVGAPPAELVGQFLSNFVSPADRATLADQMKALRTTGKLQHEFSIVRKNAPPIRVEATSRFFDENGRTRCLSILRDVTERRKAEEEIKKSALRFRALAEALPSIVWTADAAGRVDFFNAAWGSVTGLSADEGIGEGWARAIHPADQPRLVHAWRKAIADQAIYEQEARVQQRDGSYRWYLNRGYPVREGNGHAPRWVGTSTDIDAVKRSEEALRARGSWLQSIVETIPHMVWTANTEGKLEYQSRQLLEYTGPWTPSAELLPWAPLVHLDDHPSAEQLWRRMTGGVEPLNAELRMRRHDGVFRWLALSAAPETDHEGRVLGWIGTWTDIDAQKAATEALHEADRRKDDFLAVLSHELRNPLAPIRLGLRVLEQTPPGSETWHRSLQILHRQSDHLARLVGDLLDLTRINSGKVRLHLEPLNLAELVARCVEDHRAEFASHGVALEWNVLHLPVFVLADATRISQSVGNLLQNAAKFSKTGGRASVRLETDGATAHIVVEDDGQGIDPRILPHLFQPFMQAELGIERSHGGLGLGLALVRSLVEMHGGAVAASSKGLGHGSRFVITLPTIANPPLSVKRVTRDHVQKHRILIVEDNADAAEMVRTTLELAGHDVATVSDGTAALAAAIDFRPDVVLCDIGLPGMDGFAVARVLRGTPALAGMRLYALSGYAMPEDFVRARDAGFSGLIAKPASPTQLLDAVAGKTDDSQSTSAHA